MAFMVARATQTTASGSAASSYAGTAWQVLAGDEIIVVVTNVKAATPDTPTLSGRGLTWVQKATVTFGTIAAPTARLTVFVSYATADDASNVTADFAGVNQLDCSISEVAYTGTLFGTNGKAAIIQQPTNHADAATSLAVTLAAYDRSQNGSFCAVAILGTATITPEAGQTALTQVAAAAAVNTATFWRNDTADTTPSASWTGAVGAGGIALELASSAALDADTGTGTTDAFADAGYLQSRKPSVALLSVGAGSGTGGTTRAGYWNPPQPRRN
jgi:hypothetical protein